MTVSEDRVGKASEPVSQPFLYTLQSLVSPGHVPLVTETSTISSSASSVHASLLQAIDSLRSLAFRPQTMSQAPQLFRPSEMQATCDGCFARQSICSVISLHSRHVQGSTSIAFLFCVLFCMKLMESVRMMACVVRL